MPTDKELIQESISGNRAMQNKLYQKFAPAMMGLCLRYSKGSHDAEDILQEGFIKVFTCIKQYSFKGSFEGWIKKIMVNCALQRLRNKNLLYPVSTTGYCEDEPFDANAILDAISTKELLSLIQGLPPMCRIVFNLHVFEGLKHKEIADMLEISEGTSKSNLHDARKMLQRKLSDQNVLFNLKSGA